MASTLTIDGYAIAGTATAILANMVAIKRAIEHLAESGKNDLWVSLPGTDADGNRAVNIVRIRPDSAIAVFATDDSESLDGYFDTAQLAYDDFFKKYGPTAENAGENVTQID